MKKVSTIVKLLSVAFIMTLCVNSTLNAQTPADDPGIGGAGAGVSPGMDGAPIVPFDGGMNVLLLASGLALATFALNKQTLVLVRK